MNISAGLDLSVAVREFPLKPGPVDYLLYVDGKAMGVVEAKPEGVDRGIVHAHVVSTLPPVPHTRSPPSRANRSP